MWFMPSYGRPDRLRQLLDAPGGWPDSVIVLVNEDDPQRAKYDLIVDRTLPHTAPWKLCFVPAGSRCSDAHRYITEKWPDEPFYGLICDDHWPITPGWHDALVKAAGRHCISGPAGEPSFPLLRNVVVLGGDLVRAMGSIVPAPVKHNFEDNIWDRVAADFDILRPVPDAIVEHRHWIRGQADKDTTYERGSHDFEADKAIYERWCNSPERKAMNDRIAAALNVNVSTVDPKAVRLAILVPIGDEHVDVGYHKSLHATMAALAQAGIPHKVIEAAGGSNVGKARERLLWDAWYDYRPTHLMLIDADMGWQPRQLTRLLCSPHEFACVVGVRKKDDLSLCANFYPTQEFHPTTKFLKIKDVGFAFVMLKASVIEKMMAAYPELEYNAGKDRREFALFCEMIDKTDNSNGPHGERLSEDYSFCRRWTAIGGKIWCDADQAITHAGRKEYTGKVSDLFQYTKAAAA
jgi:hypothetical protein